MARARDRYDFLPSIVAAMERPPVFYTRVVSFLVILLTVIAGLWAYLSRTDIVVSAQGKIVPAGQVKVVQAAEPGIVRDIVVGDGQFVDAGETLITLDNTASKAEEVQLRMRRARTRLTVQRLRAELGQSATIGSGIDVAKQAVDTERMLLKANQAYFAETVLQLKHKRDEANAARAVARRQLDKLRTRIDLLETRLEKKRAQAERGLVPGEEVDEVIFELESARKELAVSQERAREAGIRVRMAREKLESARMERDSKLYRELAKAQHELDSIAQDLIKARERRDNQVFKAPVSGVVQQLAVHTIGAVVDEGQRLMVIVPAGAGLEMDAKVLNKDIGFVQESQPARIKVDAFEFTRYGHIEGELQWVGSDAVVDEQRGPVYPARISLSETSMQRQADGREAAVVPGMRATADIVIGERRLIEYFIAPLLRYRDGSLRER